MAHHTEYAQNTPNKAAIIMEDGTRATWTEFSELVNKLVQYFKSIGLKVKDHIAVFMENNEHYLKVATAAIDSGLIYTCVSTHLQESEIEYILENSEAKLLIVSPEKCEMAARLKKKLKLGGIVVGGEHEDFESFHTILEQQPNKPTENIIAGHPMLYTSGTTGRPKGVMKAATDDVKIGNLPKNMQLLVTLYKIDDQTVYLSPAPLYHAAPLAFCTVTMAMGGTVVLMKKFDAEKSLALIDRYQVTHSQWVPTMFIRMLKLSNDIRKKYNVSSMNFAIHAAAPCPVEIKEEMIKWWGPIILEYYGASEGNTLVMINSEEWLSHKGSVGKCYLGKIHILNDDGKEMPIGQPGLIYIEGGVNFQYFKDKEKTEDSRNPNGWTTLGDIGYVDEEGYLYLTDRKSNMIISGGVNIYPQEIENLLILHPKVTDVAVFGIPHPEFAEEVKAVIQPANMNDAKEDLAKELMAYCRERMSHVKCPKSIDFDPDLPRTPTGKLIKRKIKEKYLTDKKT